MAANKNIKNPVPMVSIVVLNWNGLEDTKICLDHIRKLDYSNYEVIVVDNGSKKSEKDYLSKLRDIVYVDNLKNRGFAGGQTDGYKVASGNFILLLNNDAVIKKDYLKNAMSLFDDPKVAVVGGRSYFWNEKEELLNEKNRFYAYMNIDPVSAETTLMMSDHGATQEVNVVSGSAVLVRRTVIDEVGYLWEPFFAYYEETDLFARIKRAGYKVLYSPNVQIWHKNGASSGAQTGSSFFFYHIFRNRFMFAVRNFDSNYLKMFYKNYYKIFLQAIPSVFSSKSQRRYVASYAKAIAETIVRLPSIKRDRKLLEAKLDSSSYSRQIIREQISLSIVIDARKHSPAEISELYKQSQQNQNPLTEYVVVTSKPHKDFGSSKIKNFRLVVDRGYFNVNPINLGCIAAVSPWLIVANKMPDINRYSELIAESFTKDTQVIQLDKAASSLAITKGYYQKIGGFTESASSLADCIGYCISYANTDEALITDFPVLREPIAEDEDIKNVVHFNNRLHSKAYSSKFDGFLSKNYRFQQLNNLIRWIFLPKISIRHKVARLKNLFLFGVSLNRSKLATELKHIRNELMSEKRDRGMAELSQFHKQNIIDFTQKQLSTVSDIPVFIICFERVEDLRVLVSKLESMGLKKIVFIDNNSSYPPLLKYLEDSPYQTIRLYRNVGHTAPWILAIVKILIPYGYYIVTDPDVIPTNECVKSEPIERLISLHKKYPAHQKVGFGLKIDDLPSHYPLKNDVVEWENQFWSDSIEPDVYEAGVDTTFALYKPGTFNYMLNPSLRTGEPYVARHMPWYSDPSRKSTEDIYYRQRANTDVTSWNVDELPERYQKEMYNDKK